MKLFGSKNSSRRAGERGVSGNEHSSEKVLKNDTDWLDELTQPQAPAARTGQTRSKSVDEIVAARNKKSKKKKSTNRQEKTSETTRNGTKAVP